MIAEKNKLWKNKLIIEIVESIWKMLNMWNKILENIEQLTSLSLENVNNIKWCNCLAFNLFNICYNITKDTLKKNFKNTVNFIINYNRNTLDIIITHKMMNSELDDIHNVVSKNFVIMLSITFNNVHNVVLKNFVIMFNITLDDTHNVVLKNFIITFSITFFKTFIIFAVCWRTC